jgi:8-oxo-dGTP pyrophosphatase MutT (NUDIX family)
MSRWTKEDLQSKYESISCIVRKGNEILVLYHEKLQKWTIPIGKINKGESISECVKREMKEELNIIPTKIKKLGDFTKIYHLEGHDIEIKSHIINIEEYSGEIENLEPHKHTGLMYFTDDVLCEMRGFSDSTNEAMRHLIIFPIKK